MTQNSSKKDFALALSYGGYLLEDTSLSQKDLEKARKIIGKKPKCSFKVGQTLTKDEVQKLPIGSIVIFGSTLRFVVPQGLSEPNLGRTHKWELYYETDRFILKYINE